MKNLLICVLLSTFASDLAAAENPWDARRVSDPTIQATITGTLTTSDKTFDSRFPPTQVGDCDTPTLVGLATDQFYDVHVLSPNDTQPVDINVTFALDVDTMIFLYCDPFDPLFPETNMIFGDDDDGFSGYSRILASDNVTLTPGNNYFLVITTVVGGVEGLGSQGGNYIIETSDNLDVVTDASEIPRPRTLVVSNVPDPFNPSTEIRYELTQSGKVTVTIFDATGRLIRTLFDGVQGAGYHAARWDGRTNRGGQPQTEPTTLGC